LNEGIEEAAVNLNGVILKKAELENNFEKVYLKVFEKMVQIDEIEENGVLKIFGDLGG